MLAGTYELYLTRQLFNFLGSLADVTILQVFAIRVSGVSTFDRAPESTMV